VDAILGFGFCGFFRKKTIPNLCSTEKTKRGETGPRITPMARIGEDQKPGIEKTIEGEAEATRADPAGFGSLPIIRFSPSLSLP
jgi:hypothetical protein